MRLLVGAFGVIEVIPTVHLPFVKPAYLNSVGRTFERAARTHKALVAENKFAVSYGDIVRRAVFNAFHTLYTV